jgi:hypothetical protein
MDMVLYIYGVDWVQVRIEPCDTLLVETVMKLRTSSAQQGPC